MEIELRDREREAETLREGLEPRYDAFQAKEDELRRAKEVRDKAHGGWTIHLSAVQSADERARRTRVALDEMRGER